MVYTSFLLLMGAGLSQATPLNFGFGNSNPLAQAEPPTCKTVYGKKPAVVSTLIRLSTITRHPQAVVTVTTTKTVGGVSITLHGTVTEINIVPATPAPIAGSQLELRALPNGNLIIKLAQSILPGAFATQVLPIIAAANSIATGAENKLPLDAQLKILQGLPDAVVKLFPPILLTIPSLLSTLDTLIPDKSAINIQDIQSFIGNLLGTNLAGVLSGATSAPSLITNDVKTASQTVLKLVDASLANSQAYVTGLQNAIAQNVPASLLTNNAFIKQLPAILNQIEANGKYSYGVVAQIQSLVTQTLFSSAGILSGVPAMLLSNADFVKQFVNLIPTDFSSTIAQGKEIPSTVQASVSGLVNDFKGRVTDLTAVPAQIAAAIPLGLLTNSEFLKTIPGLIPTGTPVSGDLPLSTLRDVQTSIVKFLSNPTQGGSLIGSPIVTPKLPVGTPGTPAGTPGTPAGTPGTPAGTPGTPAVPTDGITKALLGQLPSGFPSDLLATLQGLPDQNLAALPASLLQNVGILRQIPAAVLNNLSLLKSIGMTLLSNEKFVSTLATLRSITADTVQTLVSTFGQLKNVPSAALALLPPALLQAPELIKSIPSSVLNNATMLQAIPAKLLADKDFLGALSGLSPPSLENIVSLVSTFQNIPADVLALLPPALLQAPDLLKSIPSSVLNNVTTLQSIPAALLGDKNFLGALSGLSPPSPENVAALVAALKGLASDNIAAIPATVLQNLSLLKQVPAAVLSNLEALKAIPASLLADKNFLEALTGLSPPSLENVKALVQTLRNIPADALAAIPSTVRKNLSMLQQISGTLLGDKNFLAALSGLADKTQSSIQDLVTTLKDVPVGNLAAIPITVLQNLGLLKTIPSTVLKTLSFLQAIPGSLLANADFLKDLAKLSPITVDGIKSLVSKYQPSAPSPSPSVSVPVSASASATVGAGAGAGVNTPAITPLPNAPLSLETLKALPRSVLSAIPKDTLSSLQKLSDSALSEIPTNLLSNPAFIALLKTILPTNIVSGLLTDTTSKIKALVAGFSGVPSGGLPTTGLTQDGLKALLGSVLSGLPSSFQSLLTNLPATVLSNIPANVLDNGLFQTILPSLIPSGTLPGSNVSGDVIKNIQSLVTLVKAGGVPSTFQTLLASLPATLLKIIPVDVLSNGFLQSTLASVIPSGTLPSSNISDDVVKNVQSLVTIAKAGGLPSTFQTLLASLPSTILQAIPTDVLGNGAFQSLLATLIPSGTNPGSVIPADTASKVKSLASLVRGGASSTVGTVLSTAGGLPSTGLTPALLAALPQTIISSLPSGLLSSLKSAPSDLLQLIPANGLGNTDFTNVLSGLLSSPNLTPAALTSAVKNLVASTGNLLPVGLTSDILNAATPLQLTTVPSKLITTLKGLQASQLQAIPASLLQNPNFITLLQGILPAVLPTGGVLPDNTFGAIKSLVSLFSGSFLIDTKNTLSKTGLTGTTLNNLSSDLKGVIPIATFPALKALQAGPLALFSPYLLNNPDFVGVLSALLPTNAGSLATLTPAQLQNLTILTSGLPGLLPIKLGRRDVGDLPASVVCDYVVPVTDKQTVTSSVQATITKTAKDATETFWDVVTVTEFWTRAFEAPALQTPAV